MTRRERLERKLERREQWAASASARSDERYDAARSAIEGIPPGQPILVDHYSARRHRAALDRHDTRMRKSIEERDKAAHHAAKAEGLADQLAHSIFSDDPDAIEALTAKIQAAERDHKRMVDANRIIRSQPKYKPAPEKIARLVALGMSEAVASRLFVPDCCNDIGFPAYKLSNSNANIHRMRLRIKDIERRQQRTAEAAASDRGFTVRGGETYVVVTFAEKPGRSILSELKAAGFRWGGGSWHGRRNSLPECLQ